jgi:hypothetical protein
VSRKPAAAVVQRAGGRSKQATVSPHQDPLPCHLCSVKEGAGEINRGRSVGSGRWASSLLARGRTEQRQATRLWDHDQSCFKVCQCRVACSTTAAHGASYIRERADFCPLIWTSSMVAWLGEHMGGRWTSSDVSRSASLLVRSRTSVGTPLHAGAFASFRFASPRPGSLLRSRGGPALSSTMWVLCTFGIYIYTLWSAGTRKIRDSIAVRRGHRHCRWFEAVQEIEHRLQRQVMPGQNFRHDSEEHGLHRS